MQTYFLKLEDLPKFYERIAEDYELYVPIKTQTPLKVKCDYGFDLPADDYLLKKYCELDKDEVVFNDYRCVEPLRSLFTHFKEVLCGYFNADQVEDVIERPVAVCGLKSCDLFSLKIQDYVFLEGVEEDPIYRKRRDNTLLIASDCPNFKEACFCRAFDINPHVSEGFDFNLSPLNHGYLLDVASEKAQKIAGSLKDLLTPATVGQTSGREGKREAVIKRIDEHLSHHAIPKKDTLKEIVLSGYNSQIWRDEMLNCVECGGCVFMCDTCHCFLLEDKPEGRVTKKIRTWDGCLFKNFGRVAGGANPLKMRYMRLRNRFLKKFDFFIANTGLQACCGCGRCIEVCPGKIDIRKILRKLYEEKHLSTH
ncbi:MAG: 4Fe-4S dicluster domain-containing protein [Candidatus Omnitrophota bacterium]